MSQRIGFAGLGLMGSRMARQILVKKGFETHGLEPHARPHARRCASRGRQGRGDAARARRAPRTWWWPASPIRPRSSGWCSPRTG